ncbi:MAG: 1-acyl-sn-glycerol-3-phosphate acyltransferase [Clostridia bacterium]|nr:1-acyl-sn-glycerol-3-phosphate acyltransferase [Clostridia bacterium]
MKIKVIKKTYREVTSLPQPKHKKPMRQSLFFRLLLYVASTFALMGRRLKIKRIGMEQLEKKEPCLYLMNHSAFIDLEIASVALFPRRFSIVCTSDALIGKRLLMRFLGCIPIKKFIFDLGLVRDITYSINDLKQSVLLFPEAGYSFDGTATALPNHLGSFVKMLGAPVVMIETKGAFEHQPLYNNLKKRRVSVSAEMRYLISPEDCQQKSAEELQALIKQQFAFDAFRRQQAEGIFIGEPDRAEGLERVLYKCPACHAEGQTEGVGSELICHACQKHYRLDEYGFLRTADEASEFSLVSDWYAWERDCVKAELKNDCYRLDCDVQILMLVNTKCLYDVGDGHLTHTKDGFRLTAADGSWEYTQKPISSYTLNSDFNWYEIGDVIGIGNPKTLYYCFPKDQKIPVAKARLATEEIYRLLQSEKKARKEKE